MRTAFRAALQRPSLILVCILSVALGFSLAVNTMHQSSVGSAIAAAPPTDTMKDWRSGFVDIAEKLGPSVVYIVSEKTVERTMPSLDDFFDFGPFGGPPTKPRVQPRLQPETVKASGSGVIIRSDGYILTNNHVVAGADRVDVRLPDGRTFKGKVTNDEQTDLAIVKIDAKDLPIAEFADSEAVKVGQWAIAVGSPFGFRNTMTVGVVSAVRTEVEPDSPSPINYPEAIQTDASINMGNSGGPLVDVHGRIIGINFMIYSRTGGNVGLGFAIPSNVAKFVVDQLIDKGKVTRGRLGVEMQDLTPALAESLGTKESAVVTSIVKDSPADKAKLHVKDVIIKVDGKPIRSGVDLRRAMWSTKPGTTVTVTVVRDKKTIPVTVMVDELKSAKEEASSESEEGGIGLSVKPLTKDLAKELEVDPSINGVVVLKVAPGSAAERANIEVNDVIVEIDNTPIESVAGYTQAVKKLKSGDTAIIVVQRGERSVIRELQVE